MSSRAKSDRFGRTTAAFLLLVLCAGCARGRARPAPDPLAGAAAAQVTAGCAQLARPPVPAASPAPARATTALDVVMYTAHPDDEAMYAGGTLARLARAGRRVALVVMSHGEGGRLLERAPDGGVVERRDLPAARVVAVRDREIAQAMGLVPAPYAHLYPAEARVDYAWTTSCDEALAQWNQRLPGGVAGALRRLVDDLRARRPRVVITLDPRDDPQASHHGHHKATGVLVELAARLAADPAVPGGAPHAVHELLTCAPADVRADVALAVDPAIRLAMLGAYASQFAPEHFDALARRPVEHFVLRWRARGVAVPPEGSVLAHLAATPASDAP